MTTRAFVMIALAGWSCGTPRRPPPSEPTDKLLAAEIETPPVAAEVASPQDQQRAKELADAVCGCVGDGGNEVACVRNLQATAPRGLPRSAPAVARQIERAQTCVRLAELQQVADQSLFVRFVEGLFR